MRTLWRVRALGALLVLAAVPALVAFPDPAGPVVATALAVTGLFVALVVERAVPAPAAEALLHGGARTLEQVAKGLGLQGRPVYVHDQGNVGEERLFIPAAQNAKPVPVLDADTTTYAGGATKAGVAVAPPGLALVREHAEATGLSPAGAALPDVEEFLQGLCATHDLASSVRVAGGERGVDVRFRAAALRPPCFDDPADPLCERTGCALCQAAGCALARSLGRPVVVAEARVEAPWVSLRLEAPEGLS